MSQFALILLKSEPITTKGDFNKRFVQGIGLWNVAPWRIHNDQSTGDLEFDF